MIFRAGRPTGTIIAATISGFIVVDGGDVWGGNYQFYDYRGGDGVLHAKFRGIYYVVLSS